MPEIHAKLSASGAKRWMSCPRSVRLESLFPEEETAYAEEGAKAHVKAETILNLKIKSYTDSTIQVELDRFINEFKKEDPDMHYYVMKYVDHCIELYESEMLKSRSVVAFVEERLDFSKWVPGGFGTGDFVLLTNDTIYIRDLKYGKGVAVSAIDNAQLRLYGLGAYADYGWIYPIKEMDMGIIQPRLNSEEFEVLKVFDLLKWGNDEVTFKATQADADCGSFKLGDHCKFCRARALCKHRALGYIKLINDILGGNN